MEGEGTCARKETGSGREKMEEGSSREKWTMRRWGRKEWRDWGRRIYREGLGWEKMGGFCREEMEEVMDEEETEGMCMDNMGELGKEQMEHKRHGTDDQQLNRI